MIINKQKRIGSIIIFTEGETPEFEIIEKIFNKFLGYSIVKKSRYQSNMIELQGHDRFSKVVLLNTPTSNINSLKDAKSLYDYIFKEYVLPLDLDTINNPVYFIFDRDPENNRQGIVENLLKKLTESQSDNDEQNGLLLISYPSIEAFLLSMNEKASYDNKVRLGTELKQTINLKKYKSDLDENKLLNAVNEFIDFLMKFSIISHEEEVVDKLDVLGIMIFKLQTDLYSKERLFYCLSQVVELLIDLQIIGFENL